MANTAIFYVTWMQTGKQTIELPKNINPDDPKAVKDYILSKWPGIPIPIENATYIPDSDVLDELQPIIVKKDN